ncbi:hypothetical protein [Halomarina rubra]|uniref:Uncharacterized protein n=1 Tax=Halomarina rubra TaxID=2071873 RepID=A0ABD6APW2_9EURY|nr:hypothetical protein [Halomarina rubra]
MSDAPTADRSLADRVDAIERALTDDTPPTTTTVGPVGSGLDRERVADLETELADLRASLDALRGVVAALDEGTDADEAGARTGGATADGDPTGPLQSPGPLHAPTGRPIPTSMDGDRADGDATPDVAGEVDTPAGSSEGEGSRAGILARVTETL